MIGIDIVENTRIRKILEKYSSSFLKRVFTPLEQEYCNSRRNSYIHFAARFAAKEAFLKALGTGLRHGIKWTDIEVIHNKAGAPELNITGRAREILEHKAYISISHEKKYSVAVVWLK